ncbi:MAG: class I SAM-dependent methyltransferase [Anaerolineae bacterium]
MNQKPIALDAYEALAESYAALIDTKPHNAYYERPATLSLLPEVRGKRVLDAGCGPGVYAEWLADHGAEVVAFDVSPKMVRLAKQRLGTKAQILQADLGQPLDFLEDASFNVVLSALALDYVRDWDKVFGEFYRVLHQGGHLVFSVGHPFADFLLHGTENYFQTEPVDYEWTGFGTPLRVPSYRHPLNALVNPLLEAGFVLERLLEPRPTEQFRQEAPQEYEELSRQPGFLCVRARKQ